jgi:hypothetical protein
MSTVDFIIELFCHVDDLMPDAKNHSHVSQVAASNPLVSPVQHPSQVD